MVMKIITSVLAILLVAMVGAGAVFYLKEYEPLKEDSGRMKAALPA